MSPPAQEWVDKAEADWVATGQLIRVRKSPNYDLICYEAQQSAEKYLKYLKARLVEAGLSYPKTHNLLNLLLLLLPVEPTWNTLYLPLDTLRDYAVAFRYPGQTANRDEAKEARRLCRIVRAAVRISLQLPL